MKTVNLSLLASMILIALLGCQIAQEDDSKAKPMPAVQVPDNIFTRPVAKGPSDVHMSRMPIFKPAEGMDDGIIINVIVDGIDYKLILVNPETGRSYRGLAELQSDLDNTNPTTDFAGQSRKPPAYKDLQPMVGKY